MMAAADRGRRYVFENVEVVKVVDGDTVDLKINLGFNVSFVDRFRLFGIDAYETRGPDRTKGLAAKAYLSGLLFDPAAAGLKVETHQDKGKFGRWICDLRLPRLEATASELMLAGGHAVRRCY